MPPRRLRWYGPMLRSDDEKARGDRKFAIPTPSPWVSIVVGLPGCFLALTQLGVDVSGISRAGLRMLAALIQDFGILAFAGFVIILITRCARMRFTGLLEAIKVALAQDRELADELTKMGHRLGMLRHNQWVMTLPEMISYGLFFVEMDMVRASARIRKHWNRVKNFN